jgi:magnesium chelatase family protein
MASPGPGDRRTAWVTTPPPARHILSDTGLIGGGQVPMPGEVSFAHQRKLLQGELYEYRRHVLEVLYQPPLEECHEKVVSRTSQTL